MLEHYSWTDNIMVKAAIPGICELPGLPFHREKLASPGKQEIPSTLWGEVTIVQLRGPWLGGCGFKLGRQVEESLGTEIGTALCLGARPLPRVCSGCLAWGGLGRGVRAPGGAGPCWAWASVPAGPGHSQAQGARLPTPGGSCSPPCLHVGRA